MVKKNLSHRSNTFSTSPAHGKNETLEGLEIHLDSPKRGRGERIFEGISAALFFPLTPEGGGNMGSLSDGQFHTVAFVVDGSAVTQSGLVMDCYTLCLL
jgi:hypothetical protein